MKQNKKNNLHVAGIHTALDILRFAFFFFSDAPPWITWNYFNTNVRTNCNESDKCMMVNLLGYWPGWFPLEFTMGQPSIGTDRLDKVKSFGLS